MGYRMDTSPAIIDPRIQAILAPQAPVATEAPPALSNTIALPNQSAPTFGTSIGAPVVNPFPNQTQIDQTKRNQYINSGDGVSQVHNPLLRGIARTADILGSVFAPNLAQFIPGTALHHQLLVNQATNNVAKDQAEEQATAQTGQTQAGTEHVNAETAALVNPTHAYTPLQTDSGIAAFDHKTGLAAPVMGPDGTQVGAPIKTAKVENLQQDYADAVMDGIRRGVDPASDPKVQQLGDAITSLQRQPASKEPNKDDRYIAINAKIAAKQPLTPDEAAFKAGYEHYVKVNKLDPAGVRVTAMMQMPQAIADPNDPTREIFTTKKGAIGQEAPGSGDAASARRMQVYMTSGKGGQTLNAFNTASSHLQLLGQAADALNNGDSTLLNGVSQSFAKATGSPAPTNFDAVKTAVEGEVAKTFTGGNATVSEQAELKNAIDKANSPAQLHGAIGKFYALMQSKKEALHSQYEAGIKGQADFGEPSPQAATHVYNQKTGKIELVK